ncbi:Zinc finger and BTB domain-containing protein 41 [Pseudolycoriella hygida]|uniref:Zinc finger and BTB domain-containing protein 41 n=1 Tax=Pseudolycoriella hygida TaxID=35572 RepID=A0A9Q0RVE9_9DIPT|nr:Zinc finger and BTB domain-containing protein 41 [Pseudolycoriella hygida]
MSICRSCLCSLNKPTDAVNIFDDLYKNNNLSILLPELFNIKLEFNDEITKNICKRCAKKIVEFHEFYIMYVESDRKLRTLNETECKPTVESFEFDSENTVVHEVSAVIKKEDCAEPIPSKEDEEESEIDSREMDETNDELPEENVDESNLVSRTKEKKPKRFKSLWECFACHKTYKSVKTIRKHSKNCNQTTSNYKTTYYHKTIDDEFVCNVCNKSFKSRQSVNAHIQRHIGQKLLCNICGKYLSNRNNLTKHYKTVHLKEKRYQCPQCQKRYDSGYRLRIHQNSHEGIRLFGCPLCPQRFITSSALSRHKKTVHKQGELYECNICFRKFNIAYNLRAHMVTHTGIRPHNCQYCKADFQRKHKLVSHLKDVHGIDSTTLETTSSSSNLMWSEAESVNKGITPIM